MSDRGAAAIRIRRLDLLDAPQMLEWMQDLDVRENLGLRSEPSLELTERWIHAAGVSESTHAFAIVAGVRHVGNVVLDRIDSFLSTARLSIYIGAADMRGRGVGKAALRLALREAFDVLRLHKVWLIVHAANGAAIAAYVAAGFSVEGVLRDEFILRGRRVPAIYMGILRSELQPYGDHL